MNNEPVAWMFQGAFDISTYVSFEKPNPDIYPNPAPLYTHPAKEQYKFGVDWSKDGNAVTVLKIYEGGVAEIVFTDYQEVTHPAKTLTDEEVKEYYESTHKTYAQYEGFVEGVKWASKITKVLNVPAKTCKHGVDDGACKECYAEAQEK